MAFHLFHIREIYSSADAKVQYIEFVGDADGQHFWAGHTLTSTNGVTTRSFTFPGDLPGAATAGKSVLVATQSFAALGLVKPDYIVPDGFLFRTGGTVAVAGMDSVAHGALPAGGTQSVDDSGAVGTNSPTNFAGTKGFIPGNPVVGSAAAEVLTGTAARDYMVALGGRDTIDGGAGADTMRGGSGDDTYTVNVTGDVVVDSGGVAGGSDLVRTGLAYRLGASVERLTLTGTASVNGTGNEQSNIITANVGANLLSGLAGNDILRGGAGNDTLVGGPGNDRLSGGTGLDTFRFGAALNSATNVDALTDFTAADDRFQLDDAVFAGIGAVGALAPGAFRIGAVALDANDRVLYDRPNGRLLFDADGSGAQAAILFATVSPGTPIGTLDFFVI